MSHREPYRSSVGVVTGTLAVMMAVRGLDYATGDSAHVARNLSAARDFLPLRVWGVLFLVGAVATGVAMVASHVRVSWWPQVLVAAHILAAALYTTLGYSIAEVAATRGFDGIRNAAMLVGVAVIHAALAMTEAAAERQRRRR